MIIGSLANIRDRIVGGDWQGKIVSHPDGDALDADCVVRFETFFAEQELSHGDCVVIIVNNTLNCIAAMVAAWSAGLVVVPVQGKVHDAGVAGIAADSQARLIFEPSTGATLAGPGSRSLTKRFLLRRRPEVAGTDLALIIYTSGSTGIPKGIMLTHANVIAALMPIGAYLNIEKSDRILCLLPLSFDYGLYQILFAFHSNCTTFISANTFDPLTCLQVSQREAITIWPVVPAMAVALARLLGTRAVNVPSLRLVTNTGGHLPVHVIETFARMLPDCGICAMYGLSESKRALFLSPADAIRRAGSVGKPMLGLAAAIFEEVVINERTVFVEVEDGRVGELYVRGPSVMQGYRSGEGGGARIIAGQYRDDNWLATGDLFSRDAGGYFYFRGRLKELIKQDAVCLYPRDIEQIAERHPGIELAVVFGVDDEWGREQACLVAKRACCDLGANDFEKWLSGELGADQKPRYIRLVDEVPLSRNGKPDRGKMREVLKIRGWGNS